MQRRLWLAVAALAGPSCGPAPAEPSDTEATSQPSSATHDAAQTTDPSGATSGACPGEPATSTHGAPVEPTEGASELCPDHPEVDACCCFAPDFPLPAVVCERHDLCPQIVVGDSYYASSEFTTACPAEIDCALAALIAGKPGTLRWIDPTGDEGRLELMEIHLLGDGTAMISYFLQQDLGCSGDVTRHKLRERSVFQHCAEQATAVERFACLRDPVFDTVLDDCRVYSDCRPSI